MIAGVRAPLLSLALGAAAVMGGSTTARAGEALVADLSSREIAITAGFSGTSLLLFGSVDGDGDVVIVVRGPKRRELLHRKVRVAGVWVNGETVTFDDVPAYYRIASTAPLDRVASARTLDRLRIGISRTPLRVVESDLRLEPREYRAALVRNKQKLALYGKTVGQVTVIGGRLFRTAVGFPANVPTGIYSVDVFLFRNGKVISQFNKPLAVYRAGIEARVFNFAHKHGALYGAVAILIALVAGWLAGVIFRKV